MSIQVLCSIVKFKPSHVSLLNSSWVLEEISKKNFIICLALHGGQSIINHSSSTVNVDEELVEANTEPPNPQEAEVEFKAWRKKNAAALHAILISCSSSTLSYIREIDCAKLCWNTLATVHKGLLQLRNKEESSNDECVKYRPLCQAIVKEDLAAVESFLHHHPEAINRKITHFEGCTALHLATITGNIKLVEKLVELMSEEDLEIVDNSKATALYSAAAIEATRIVELLNRKNKKLVTIPVNGVLPVAAACLYGHRDLVSILQYSF
ncbi:hypothetical protein GH714_043729 [Hevea brasiliensis]|uniref:Uncharacterized protein n=1 Tax=Hevea brasiliensis TaxID=3981 RepID=A0A6A6K1Y0_HEVBR|nr:hypothetical protein GH714_043729 [Hevea brasiliensis]